jgi:hypothetical protein
MQLQRSAAQTERARASRCNALRWRFNKPRFLLRDRRRSSKQLSPAVIRIVGRENIIVIATLDELHGLDGPLRVDTGGDECARLLEGYVRVVTLPRERVIWRVMA